MSDSNTTYRVRWKGTTSGPFSEDRILADLAGGRISLAHQLETEEGWRPVSWLAQRIEERKRAVAREEATRLMQAQAEKAQAERARAEQRVTQPSPQAHSVFEPHNQAAPPPPASHGYFPPLSSAPPPAPDFAPPAYSDAPPPYPGSTQTSGMAITAFVLSLLGFAPIAVILGHLALGQIASDPSKGGRGLAIAALCIGYLTAAIGVAAILYAVSLQ